MKQTICCSLGLLPRTHTHTHTHSLFFLVFTFCPLGRPLQNFSPEEKTLREATFPVILLFIY